MYKSTDKTPLAHVNLRLPQEVLEYYKDKYPAFTTGMRNILVAEYERATGKKTRHM